MENVTREYHLDNCTALFNYAGVSNVIKPCDRFHSALLWVVLGLTLQVTAKIVAAMFGGAVICGMFKKSDNAAEPMDPYGNNTAYELEPARRELSDSLTKYDMAE